MVVKDRWKIGGQITVCCVRHCAISRTIRLRLCTAIPETSALAVDGPPSFRDTRLLRNTCPRALTRYNTDGCGSSREWLIYRSGRDSDCNHWRYLDVLCKCFLFRPRLSPISPLDLNLSGLPGRASLIPPSSSAPPQPTIPVNAADPGGH